jgi:hypothetical protein
MVFEFSVAYVSGSMAMVALVMLVRYLLALYRRNLSVPRKRNIEMDRGHHIAALEKEVLRPLEEATKKGEQLALHEAEAEVWAAASHARVDQMGSALGPAKPPSWIDGRTGIRGNPVTQSLLQLYIMSGDPLLRTTQAMNRMQNLDLPGEVDR